jgi:pullulanase
MRPNLLLPLLLGFALTGCGRDHAITGRLAAPASAGHLTAAVTFRVAVPASTPAGDLVYVAGDFQSWNPGNPAHALAKQPDGRWTITLDLPAGTPVQFKFTRGTWGTVEKGANGEEIANRSLTPAAGATYDFTVLRWADNTGTITGNVTSFTYAPFLSGRRVWVYLPPGYDAATARYPVLYMHDGQNLFDVRTSFAGEWKVDETCEQLIGNGELTPFIVVGIENGPGRISEYTPWPDPSYGGGQAEAYLQAIIGVLKPEIDSRYRTLTSSSYTWMAGSSLGGLVSAYAGLAHGDVFGRVAALSPSYWWDSRHMITWAAGRPRGTLRRVYQDMGTVETGNPSNPANATYIEDLRLMRDALIEDGFTLALDLQSIEAAGHMHNEASWALRLPDALRLVAGSPATADVR